MGSPYRVKEAGSEQLDRQNPEKIGIKEQKESKGGLLAETDASLIEIPKSTTSINFDIESDVDGKSVVVTGITYESNAAYMLSWIVKSQLRKLINAPVSTVEAPVNVAEVRMLTENIRYLKLKLSILQTLFSQRKVNIGKGRESAVDKSLYDRAVREIKEELGERNLVITNEMGRKKAEELAQAAEYTEKPTYKDAHESDEATITRYKANILRHLLVGKKVSLHQLGKDLNRKEHVNFINLRRAWDEVVRDLKGGRVTIPDMPINKIILESILQKLSDEESEHGSKQDYKSNILDFILQNNGQAGLEYVAEGILVKNIALATFERTKVTAGIAPLNEKMVERLENFDREAFVKAYKELQNELYGYFPDSYGILI